METMSSSASASASASANDDGKPLVVRVKRKREQPAIDALWLEINERPQKRRQDTLSLAQLSLSSTSDGISKSRKLLFHHVETLNCSDEEKGFLESVLHVTREDGKLQERHKEQREDIKKSKDKQDQLRASARQKHEVDAKNARFKQVWRSRKGIAENSDDSAISELYHLYDVVRVDEEEEMHTKLARREKAKSEATVREDQLLCNYLPLMREYLPSAAAEFEAQLDSSQTTEKDDYVYDVYTLRKCVDIAEDVAADYPLVQVDDDEEFYFGDPVDSDVDSEDSNDENNPLNEYPEEESESEDECQSTNSEHDDWDSVNEGEDNDEFDSDEEDRRWACRR